MTNPQLSESLVDNSIAARLNIYKILSYQLATVLNTFVWLDLEHMV